MTKQEADAKYPLPNFAAEHAIGPDQFHVGDLVKVRVSDISVTWRPEHGTVGIVVDNMNNSVNGDARYFKVRSTSDGVALWVRKYRLSHMCETPVCG